MTENKSNQKKQINNKRRRILFFVILSIKDFLWFPSRCHGMRMSWVVCVYGFFYLAIVVAVAAVEEATMEDQAS